MNSIERISGFFGLCLMVLFGCSRLASAGVPSPTPGAVTEEVQIANLGDFKFESGEVVKDFKVSYVTHGKLNERKDNVILAMDNSWGVPVHFLIGPGKALDTDKYFIVQTDRLGDPLVRQNITTGPTNSGLKMQFPRYTVRDSVNAEYKVLKEHLGFDHILAAIGASMGGMAAYQFGVSYPTYVRGLISISGTPVTNPQVRALKSHLCDILALDSGWHGGNYETNPIWAVNTMIWNWLPWYYTPEWFATNLKTEEQYRQWEKFWNSIFRNYPMDARDWYYTNKAEANFNIGDTRGFNGDAKAALQSIQAQVLIIGAKGDMHFRPEESIFARDSIPNAVYLEIDNTWGHLNCAGFEPEAAKMMHREISKFLSNLAAGAQ
jgi:homoserine O-acetyltransferase